MDAWKGYNDLKNQGYKHIKTNLSDSGDPAHIVIPGVHRVASLLRGGSWELIKVQ